MYHLKNEVVLLVVEISKHNVYLILTMKRNILTIFLASPSDLQEERRIVRKIVVRVNNVLSRRVGWHIELLGWEDTLPGGSRPQSLINKDVDACQLFLGILWRRWGQETKKYSSGFDEEFQRVQGRRNKTGSPEIWLFFKSIDEASAKDPGDQLKKVFHFKNEIIRSKELLFKEFSETTEWETNIYDNLLKYVIDLSNKESEIESQEESILEGKAREPKPTTKTVAKEDVEPYPSELLFLFNKINTTLNEGKASNIEPSDRMRLYLQSSAWFASDYSWRIFGNHEINLVYTSRRDWELSITEIMFLVRSFISDTHDNRPGWYWLIEQNEDEIDSIIGRLAANDWNIDVRRRALSLLVDTGFHAKRDLIEKGINDSDEQIKLDTINLIRNVGNLENLDLLDKVIKSEESDIKLAAISAKIDLLYLSNPNDGFSYLIDSGSIITPLILKTLDDMSLAIDNRLLFDALKKADASVRRFSAQYIRKSKLLSRDTADELLNDTDPFVRKEGLLELIELDEEIDIDYIKKVFPEPKEQKSLLLGHASREVKAEEFILLLLRKRDPDQLLSQLDFFTVNDDEAYRILAVDHFDIIEARIRSDLDDNFDTFRQDSETRWREKYGFGQEIYKPDIFEFIRDKFISAAIDGLANNENPDDIKYARQYLGNTKYNMADKGAINILSKFGDSSDVEPLIIAAINNYGQIQRMAVETAYNLAENKEALLERLINDENKSIAKIGLQILLKHKTERKVEISQSLFKSESDELRVESLAIVVNECGPPELEKELDEYISQGSYYYNIVTWLDRCLYSKGKYLQFYKTKLSSMVQLN